MSYTKRWLEDLSVITGGDGEITNEVLQLGKQLIDVCAANGKHAKMDNEANAIKIVPSSQIKNCVSTN